MLLCLQSVYCLFANNSTVLWRSNQDSKQWFSVVWYIMNRSFCYSIECWFWFLEHTLRPLGYERVYLPLYKVADKPYHIQGDVSSPDDSDLGAQRNISIPPGCHDHSPRLPPFGDESLSHGISLPGQWLWREFNQPYCKQNYLTFQQPKKRSRH